MSKLETLERETEEERDRRVCLFVGVKGEREREERVVCFGCCCLGQRKRKQGRRRRNITRLEVREFMEG